MKAIEVWVLVILVVFALILGAAFRIKQKRDNDMKITSFVIESGPEAIGESKIFVIRHIETNKKFIFTNGRASTMTPLN